MMKGLNGKVISRMMGSGSGKKANQSSQKKSISISKGHYQGKKGKGKEMPLYGRRYPWDTWFEHSKLTLYRGTDFSGRIDTFAQQVRNAAGPRRFNKKVKIEIRDADTIVIYLSEKEKKGEGKDNKDNKSKGVERNGSKPETKSRRVKE